MTNEQTKRDSGDISQSNKSANLTLTPELVQEISEGVYRLLLADLRIERERNRALVRHRATSTLR